MAAPYQSIPLQDLNRPSDENHNAPAPQSHRRTLSDRGRNLLRQTGGITTGQFRSCQFATIADVSPSPTRRPRLNTDTAVGQSGIQRMVPEYDGDVTDSPIDTGAFQAAIGFGMDMNFQGDTSPPLSALRKSNSTSSLSQTAVILDLEDRKLGGLLHGYPQSMPQRQPQAMMPSELPTIVSSNPHVAGMSVHSFLSPCSSPMLTPECNDLSYPRTTGKLNDSPKWMSSGLAEVDFELEEVSNDVSNTENIIILPDCCEDAESDRGVATLQDTGVMDRFKGLQFAESSADEESKERIYLRKKKQWNAGLFKRTHSQSVEEESSYSNNDSRDDNKPEAQRLRRKLRGPRPLDRRGSLIFEDKGFLNTDPYSMPYTTASPYHTIPTTLTPEMPTYTYLPPPISSAYPTTLPGHLPSMKSEYYAEEDLSPFGVGYAAIGGIDIPPPHAYADHNAHVRISTRQQSYSYARKDDRDEISKTGVCSEQSQQETVYDGALYRSPPTSQKHLFPITVSMDHGTEAKSEIGAEEGARCRHPGCGKVFFRPDLLKRHEERQ
ncbi:calcium channel protein [Epicoccum nigrum]|nr:calcium channel protein [Epicoccum nigrum]